MDRITLYMGDASAAEEETWSFRAIKVGDINCNMDVDEFTPGGEGDGLLTVSTTGTNCVIAGNVITVEVNATSGTALLGYQLGMRFDNANLQFLGISSGNLPDFNQDNFAPAESQIRTVWYKNNAQPESLTAPKTLFKLHVLTHNGEYLSGAHSHTFNSLNSLSSGSLNYLVKIGNLSYSGVIIKSQE